MSTVGYGDISPTYTLSRIAITVLVILVVSLLPIELNKINNIMLSQSEYKGRFRRKKKLSHVIVCGDINNKAKLERFYREFFHEERTSIGTMEFIAIAFSPEEPTKEVRLIGFFKLRHVLYVLCI